MSYGTDTVLEYQLDEESIEYLKTVCRGIPFQIDYDAIRLSLDVSADVEITTGDQHSAFVEDAGIYYNPVTGWSDFALMVRIPDLSDSLAGGKLLMYTLPLARNILALDRKKKAYVNSVCTSFFNDKQELTLVNGVVTKQSV